MTRSPVLRGQRKSSTDFDSSSHLEMEAMEAHHSPVRSGSFRQSEVTRTEEQPEHEDQVEWQAIDDRRHMQEPQQPQQFDQHQWLPMHPYNHGVEEDAWLGAVLSSDEDEDDLDEGHGVVEDLLKESDGGEGRIGRRQ